MNRNTSSTRTPLMIIAAAMMLSVALPHSRALAQPGATDAPPAPAPAPAPQAPESPGTPRPPRDGPQRARDPEARKRPALDRDSMLRMMRAAVDRTKRFEQQLQVAIDDLERGTDPAEVRRKFERTMRDDRQNAAREIGFIWEYLEGPGMREGPRDGPRDAMREGRGEGDRPLDAPPGGPGPDGGPGGGPGDRRPLGPEDRARLIALVRERNPGFADQLERFDRDAPEASGRFFAGLAGRLRDMSDLEKRDPELFDLRANELMASFEVMSTVRDFHRLRRENGDQAALDAQQLKVKEAFSRQFDANMRIRQREVADLEKRLSRMRDEIARAGSESERSKLVDEKTRAVLSGRPSRPGPGPDGPRGERPERPAREPDQGRETPRNP